MDAWPSDDRHRITTTKRFGRSNKGKGVPCNYPNLEQGSINSATLFEKDGRLEWVPAVKNPTTGRYQLHLGKPVKVFPPTRPQPPFIPQMTILQQSEQGAHFLRTYLPDIDIPAELIREEVAHDAKVSRKLELFDPHIGNLLEPVIVSGPASKESVFLAFPMGELSRDLNISPLHYSEAEKTLFKPSARPLHTFNTPIQQIVSSKASAIGTQESYLGVRTFGLTSLLKLNTSALFNGPPKVVELATILSGDVGNYPVIDVKLFSSPLEALIVTERGAVYKCSAGNGQKYINLVYGEAVDDTDSFWRIALGRSSVDCIVMSSKNVKHLDLRTSTHTNLFSISKPRDLLTSVENYADDHIIRISSTREIIWVDERFPRKPLLGYIHGRNYDRSLQVQTLNTKTATTLLTSRNNNLLTLYDVSRSAVNLVQLNTPPYCLWLDTGATGPHRGFTALRHPLTQTDGEFNLFLLSDRGSLYHSNLWLTEVREDPEFRLSWSNDVKKLEEQLSNFHPDLRPHEARDFSETDFFPLYDNVFRVHTNKKRQDEERDAEALYDLLEQVPAFWRDSDVPIEHMLTMYDVVFRTGEEPTEVSRADFLIGTIVNSTRGYRALVQDRLRAQSHQTNNIWHYTITPTLKCFDPDIIDNISIWAEHLRRYDLAEDPKRPASSIRRETEAREQLVLDLALSNDIFSSQTFSSSPEGNLEDITRTLSLASKPPSVDFGYLHPLPKNTGHYTKTDDDNNNIVVSAGVGMILAEWKVGEDPAEFTFRDHGNENVDPRLIHHRTEPANNVKTPSGDTPQFVPNTQSQRPPTIATSALPRIQEVSVRTTLGEQTAPTLQRAFTLGSQFTSLTQEPAGSSQEHISSTQILPGPYGGRVFSGKKKATKKRLGGF